MNVIQHIWLAAGTVGSLAVLALAVFFFAYVIKETFKRLKEKR